MFHKMHQPWKYGEVRTSSTANLDMVIKGHMLKNLTFFKNIFKNQHLKFIAQIQNLNQSISRCRCTIYASSVKTGQVIPAPKTLRHSISSRLHLSGRKNNQTKISFFKIIFINLLKTGSLLIHIQNGFVLLTFTKFWY